MTVVNQALTDELEAVNSIYDANTLLVTENDTATSSTTTTILTLPDLQFSFLIAFPHDYPEIPPDILRTQSTGSTTRKGEGEAALNVLREVLGRTFVPGQVCLFDLIEEAIPLLQADVEDYSGKESSSLSDNTTTGRSIANDTSQDPTNIQTTQTTATDNDDKRSATPSDSLSIPSAISNLQISDIPILTSSSAALPLASWKSSEPLTVNKSTFIAHALTIASLSEAKSSLSLLLSSNKKIATATHNITAWRIKQSSSSSSTTTNNGTSYPSKQAGSSGPSTEIIIQDFDDDGESAAGGRLLHLMQLMDVWNVIVVVTRWYGGVKLGGDRFRCINNVAREVLVCGGFVKDEKEGGKDGKSGKKGKK